MAMNVVTLINGAVAVLFLFAALRDIAARMVPNWVSVIILTLGIISQLIAKDLSISLGLGALIFVASALMWHFGWLGGADAKLLGAGSVAVSPGSVGLFLFAIALAGGALALLYLGLFLVVRRPAAGPRTGLVSRILKAEVWRVHKRGPLPYATAIAAGCLFTLFLS